MDLGIPNYFGWFFLDFLSYCDQLLFHFFISNTSVVKLFQPMFPFISLPVFDSLPIPPRNKKFPLSPSRHWRNKQQQWNLPSSNFFFTHTIVLIRLTLPRPLFYVKCLNFYFFSPTCKLVSTPNHHMSTLTTREQSSRIPLRLHVYEFKTSLS